MQFDNYILKGQAWGNHLGRGGITLGNRQSAASSY
jgi:hypothetical protein